MTIGAKASLTEKEESRFSRCSRAARRLINSKYFAEVTLYDKTSGTADVEESRVDWLKRYDLAHNQSEDQLSL